MDIMDFIIGLFNFSWAIIIFISFSMNTNLKFLNYSKKLAFDSMNQNKNIVKILHYRYHFQEIELQIFIIANYKS